MANSIQAPRGTVDVLPKDIMKWNCVESIAKDTAELFGFKEIRYPTFESTELFKRGVGETTDVVQKEMYTFEKGKNSFTLRPEGTASTVRLVLQNGLLNEPMPLKLFYITSCFRGERPQAGRLREFHQFGVEMFGSENPAADVEAIMLAHTFFYDMGLDNLRLEINSIGCPTCRKNYQNALREYFTAHKESLCETCISRLDRNPMRILDCKSPECKEIAKDAPKVIDYICDDCREHFEKVQSRLKLLGLDFVINPSIVRGLDYYTRTVFEFIDDKSGLTVCGGGRYDGLVEELGGAKTPALGFAIGIERLIMTLEDHGCNFLPEEKPTVFFASIGDKASEKAAELTMMVRKEGFSAESDILSKSVKAQMKYANKKGFQYTLVLGDDELANNTAKLKNMATGNTNDVPLDDKFIDALYEITQQDAEEELCDTAEETLCNCHDENCNHNHKL